MEYCSKGIVLQLNGVICAPKDPQEWKQFNDTTKLIEFESVTGLNISGGGLIDGGGRGWWDISCRYHPKLKVYLFFSIFVRAYKQTTTKN